MTNVLDYVLRALTVTSLKICCYRPVCHLTEIDFHNPSMGTLAAEMLQGLASNLTETILRYSVVYDIDPHCVKKEKQAFETRI